MKYYAGVLVGVVIAAGAAAILLPRSRSEAASERNGAAMSVDHYVSPDGYLDGRLYYIRDDANRRCFAVWESGHTNSSAVTSISCEDILWR
jgi:hypothetical protein